MYRSRRTPAYSRSTSFRTRRRLRRLFATSPLISRRIMRVEVEKAAEGARQTIWNLMQLYFHDMTEFSPREVDNQGLFAYQYFDSYWSDGDRYPFLIRADSAIAGFALVRFDEQGRADMAE